MNGHSLTLRLGTLIRGNPFPPQHMVIKYCEFEPTQHRNKRVALFVFLDGPGDPHPLAICDVCAKKLQQMQPNAIVKERKEFEKEKKAAKKDGTPKAAPPENE